MDDAQAAMSREDDLEKVQDRYCELRETLFMAISDFSDKSDVSPKVLALLLVDLGVTSYMTGYLIDTERPSSLGLKLELDRFQREIGDFIRSKKKDADGHVRGVKDFLRTQEAKEAPEAPNVAAGAPRAA